MDQKISNVLIPNQMQNSMVQVNMSGYQNYNKQQAQNLTSFFQKLAIHQQNKIKMDQSTQRKKKQTNMRLTQSRVIDPFSNSINHSQKGQASPNLSYFDNFQYDNNNRVLTKQSTILPQQNKRIIQSNLIKNYDPRVNQTNRLIQNSYQEKNIYQENLQNGPIYIINHHNPIQQITYVNYITVQPQTNQNKIITSQKISKNFKTFQNSQKQQDKTQLTVNSTINQSNSQKSQFNLFSRIGAKGDQIIHKCSLKIDQLVQKAKNKLHLNDQKTNQNNKKIDKQDTSQTIDNKILSINGIKRVDSVTLPDNNLNGNSKNSGLRQFQYANDQVHEVNPFNLLADHLIAKNNNFLSKNINQEHGRSVPILPYQINKFSNNQQNPVIYPNKTIQNPTYQVSHQHQAFQR